MLNLMVRPVEQKMQLQVIHKKTDDNVIVAECNADYETCMISWGRKIMREDLQGYYITRWN